MVRIGVDADNGEDININGKILRPVDRVAPAVSSVAERHPDTEFVLAGNPEYIINAFGDIPSNVHIVPAKVYCPQNKKITKPVEGSSLNVLVDLAKSGEISGFLSIGDTEKVAIESIRLHRYDKVRKPTLAAQMPSGSGLYLLTDAGYTSQNVRQEEEDHPHKRVIDALSKDVFGQAIMTAVYAKRVLGTTHPRIGVLSNGIEDHKGCPLSRAVEQHFKTSIRNNGLGEFIQYQGKVESRDLSRLDILVTDGYTGNIYLKIAGDMAKLVESIAREEFEDLTNFEKFKLATGVTAVGVIKDKKNKIYARLNPSNFNGAPILGIKSAIIKGHGNSITDGVVSALERTLAYSKSNIGNEISDALGRYTSF